MNKEPIIILRDIIKTQMSLADSQIWLFNQDYKVPNTPGIFIVLNWGSSQTMCINNDPVTSGSGVQQNIYMNKKEEIIIDIFSKNNEARQRKEEVELALNSYYSQSQQELYQFRIFTTNLRMLNLSSLEGAGMLTRFNVTVPVFSWYNPSNTDEDYYDQFQNPEILTD